MNVTLIGQTNITPMGYELFRQVGFEDNPGCTPVDTLSEFAGRACYQSFHKPNPNTANSADYHANTLSHGHYSIYEHNALTFYVTGVSRALTHELIRHRHLSFSQLSQRFVNEGWADWVMPPALAAIAAETLSDTHGPEWSVYDEIDAAMDSATDTYAWLVKALERNGASRKQAREAARCVLPNMTETRIVVTGNVRAWREFVQKRNDPHADREIQELAREVLDVLQDVAPDSVSDLTEQYGDDD